MNKLAVIYNAKSGSALKLNELKKLFHDADLKPAFIKLTPNLTAELKKVYEGGATTFIAVGGDGTINAVANEAIQLGATLGILPLGTLNHFAKDLHIPTDHEKALRVIAQGRTKKIDTARVNDQLFLNNSSLGLYPLLVREREKKEGTISKWPAAIVAFFRTLQRKRSYNTTLLIDNEEKKVNTPFIFIGNNSYSLNEPGMMDRKQLTQGILEISIVTSSNILEMLRITLGIIIGKSNANRHFTSYKARNVTISLPQKHTDVAFDGETKQLSTPLIYKIQPKSLNVITPK